VKGNKNQVSIMIAFCEKKLKAYKKLIDIFNFVS